MTSLRVSHKGLTTLGDLPTILTHLDCSFNELTSLYVSSLVNLTHLDCRFNELTSLYVSSLVNLAHLFCGGNQLTLLSGLFALTNLTRLDCSCNRLTSLDGLSALTNLTDLYCSNNRLTSLDVSSLTNLTDLCCQDNAAVMILPSLSGHVSLRHFKVYDTGLPNSLLEKQHNPDAFRKETDRLACVRCAHAAAVAVLVVAKRKRIHRNVLGLIAIAVWQTRGAEAWSYEVATTRRRVSDEEST